ncbi:MAG: serine/threonine protein kinase [Bdellovibrio sp.]|nr:serine/threonine protein kinase [Bdellovibrio sp.]
MAGGQTKIERFGRYLILDHFVDGGMAKICRARYLGEQADKIVAIKMVQAQFSQDVAFKTMFMDEIKVTFGLLHPNIVQTYDYGHHNGQLYVAMEYCDGRNLKEYLDKLRDRKFVFPVEISVFIITQVCQALHYAHTLTDKMTGKEFSIIHRDISPHNIMLTFDGSVKVIDFGIAKATTNTEATQAGTIKGKLSYLAPEYLEGKELDARYDEFAVGITLWEMLCSRKMFKAQNDLAVLKKIQDCIIDPPSKINPNVPKELDEIVLKALSKDRNKRYENMDQMNRALMKFLYSHYPDFNATDLSYFAKELFKEEIKKDREKLFEFGKIDLKPFLDDLRREQSGGAEIASPQAEAKATPTARDHVLDFGFAQGQSGATKTTPGGTRVVAKDELMKRAAQTRQVKVAEIDKKSELQLGQAVVKKKVPSKTSRVADSNNATRSQGTSVGQIRTRTGAVKEDSSKFSLKTMAIALVGVVAVLTVGYFKFGEQLLAPKGTKVESRRPSSEGNVTKADMKHESIAGEEYKIVISNFEKYEQKAFVNGQEVEVSILGEIKISTPGEYILRVQTKGQEHFVRKVKIDENNPAIKIKKPNMPYAVFGYLMNSRTCVSGKLFVTLFGEERVERLPISKGGIQFPIKIGPAGEPVETDYNVFYQKDGEDIQRKLNFSIKFENDSIDLCNAIHRQSESE